MLEICALVYILFGIYLREIIFVGLLSLKNEQDKNTIIHKKKKKKSKILKELYKQLNFTVQLI